MWCGCRKLRGGGDAAITLLLPCAAARLAHSMLDRQAMGKVVLRMPVAELGWRVCKVSARGLVSTRKGSPPMDAE